MSERKKESPANHHVQNNRENSVALPLPPLPPQRERPGEGIQISVHILTRNSGETVRQALESVPGAAEILVIDGGSTDDTRTIAESFGARILKQPHQGNEPLRDFAAARNIALTHTTQPWILILDSDEVISAALWREISEIAASEEKPAGYLVPRKYVERDGTVIEYASTYPNYHLYFFYRDAAEEWIKPVHERIRLKSGTPIKKLRGVSLAPLPTPEEYKRKNLQYLLIEQQHSRESLGQWLHHRLLHTLRGRTIATLRILWIWVIPRRGKRLPLTHEFLRYWYAFELLKMTFPLLSDHAEHH